jgi:peptide/nickel transport system substrate-binding protein
MVQTGQVDVAEDIPAQNWTSIEGDSNLHLIEQEFSSSYLVYVFQNETGPTSDLKVREAISYAIDRDAVLQVALFGHGDIDCAFIPRGSWARTDFDCPTYDPDKARELLAEAGYADGGLTLRIVTYEHPIYVPAAEVLQQNLLDVGIDAQIDIVERAVWLEDAWRGGNFDITISALTREPDPDGLMSSVFRKGGGNNSSRYFNQAVEDLFDQGKSTSDPDARREIYAELQSILLADEPVTKVSSVYRASVATNAVEGLCTTPLGALGCWQDLAFTP